MGKRANGDGSIRQRHAGLWEGRCVIGDDGNGNLIRKSFYGKTKSEVAKKMREVMTAVGRGAYTPPSNLTLGEWLQTWFDTYTTSVKPTSRTVYSRILRNYLIPAIGTVRLTDLTTARIQQFFNSLERLSPKTLKDVRGVLSAACEKAVIGGTISRNPCVGVELPKVLKPEITVLSSETVPAFLAACDNDSYGEVLKVLLYTGAREGEILGLPWKNIDFDHSTITVSQQMLCQLYQIAPTKTSNSRRFSPPPQVFDILRSVKAVQDAQKILAGDAWMDQDGLVFTMPDGRPLAPNTLRKHFRKIAAQIGLPDLRVHDLRHSFVCFLLASGVDPSSVAYVVGHSNVNTTMNIYSRYTADSDKVMNQKVSEFFGQF